MSIKTFQRVEFIDITNEVDNLVKKSEILEGICFLFVPHTTAGITINENSDPAVKNDIRLKINKMIPYKEEYSHNEGNSDAHIKSSLFGNSLNLIISSGKLALGMWQGIYFCEFDGPKNRNLYIKFIAG
ncbi:MAG TPA: secondary thiamine-phosphate synthase enzyme YjbQ [Candidatus Humimicrobiaceae bacterium]|jgi:secondary thiamine-phosphate synthase enzyme